MTRRGFTLIETLAATALLAVLAAACVPMLAQSLIVLRASDEPIEVTALGLVADAVLEDPESFGLTEDLDSLGTSEVIVDWPEGYSGQDSPPLSDPISITLLTPPGEDLDHGWLVFACADATVVRWIHLDPEEDQTP